MSIILPINAYGNLSSANTDKQYKYWDRGKESYKFYNIEIIIIKETSSPLPKEPSPQCLHQQLLADGLIHLCRC